MTIIIRVVTGIADAGIRQIYVSRLVLIRLMKDLGALWVTVSFQTGLVPKFVFVLMKR